MMKCNTCGYENSQSAKFCSDCGSPFKLTCNHCGHKVKPRAKFCDNCGHDLDKLQSAPIASTPTEEGHKLFDLKEEAERRQLTVLFCDLVGSTSISEQLDPEDYRLLLTDYQAKCKASIVQFKGHVARYVGDGVLAYFGYPISHEDSAESAVRSALKIIDTIKSFDAQSINSIIDLNIRIGINTGNVVVGDIGTGDDRDQMAVVGDVPNIAARLQSIARPGTVVIGKPTFDLVRDLFVIEAIGAQRLKGIQEKMPAYKVTSAKQLSNRFEAREKSGLSHLVGREGETSLFLERWESTKEGDGQVLLLSGDAGMGKSRILKNFCDQIVTDDHEKLIYGCSQHHIHSAFYPVITQITLSMGFEQSDDDAIKQSKLCHKLEKDGLPVETHALWYSFLLGLNYKSEQAISNLSPQQCKQNVYSTIIDHYKIVVANRPMLVIVEDVHWIDPSTLELFMLWARQLQRLPCLLVLVYRSDFEHRWPHYPHFTSLVLNQLSRRESKKIVAGICKSKHLPAELFNQIIAKTDGIPLFVEELTKMVLESGLVERKGNSYILKEALTDLAIPESLHGSLMARLDRLGKTKEVAQLAATIGRRFSYDLIEAVSGLEPMKLNRALEELIDSELIYKIGVLPDVSYEFKHALVQDTSYQTLLKSTRQQYHSRIADVLENSFQEMTENSPEILAYHYMEALNHQKALALWFQAGQNAVTRSATIEAIVHFRKALSCLDFLPKSAQRDEIELKLQVNLAVSLTAVKGYAAQEVEAVLSKAYQLCKNNKNTKQLFQTLYGMWRFYLLSANYDKAFECGKHMYEIACQEKNSIFKLASYRSLGSTFFYTAEFDASRDNLKHVIDLSSSKAQKVNDSLLDVVDAVVVSRSYSAWILWLQGLPEQALEICESAINIAESRAHPFSIALALSFGCWTQQFCGNKSRTLELAQAALDLSIEYGFEFWLGWSKIFKGWASMSSPRDIDSLELMGQGLKAWKNTGSKLGQSYFMILIAEQALNTEKLEWAQNLIEEAQSFADKSGELFWQAEIYRLKGEVLRAKGSKKQQESENYFDNALQCARQQGSKSLELRAAMSIYNNGLEFSNAREDYIRVDKIYHTYTEGFQTIDLISAKAILQRESQ